MMMSLLMKLEWLVVWIRLICVVISYLTAIGMDRIMDIWMVKVSWVFS